MKGVTYIRKEDFVQNQKDEVVTVELTSDKRD